ncbi:MAG: prolyl oligopeptidase family serine peptidase [Defluviitaleaceae bacterium]|nr:prolyl oligopeptidase family serine peptidase [Defluviitaleaceae bacterium]
MKNLPIRRQSRRELVIDNYHGTIVADPYRWLEDDTAPEVQKWMQEQNSDFEAYVSSRPMREALKSRLKDLWHYAKASPPRFEAGYYYTWRNNGLQNQPVLYRSPNLEETGEIVLDPNRLSEEGTIAVIARAVSPMGNYFAYSLSTSGSDWQEIKLLNLNTLEDCPDFLKHAKFTSITWLPDESGFFYTRYPDPQTSTVLSAQARNSMVCFHRVGQGQDMDIIIHQDPDNPDWDFYISSDEEKNWLFLEVGAGTTLRRNKLFYRPMADMNAPWLAIAPEFVDGGYELIGVVDNTAYIYTQNDAPFGKVVSMKLSKDGARDIKTIIPNGTEMFEDPVIANNQLLCVYQHHATHRVKIYDLCGSFVKDIELPALGEVSAISAKSSRDECFIQFASFLYPATVLRYDFTTGKTNTWFAPEIDFPLDEYETVQEFATSKDGTQIPIFITMKKGLVKDGSHPTQLYGYGGFSVSMTPGFSTSTLVWLEKGGIYVQACLRGGLEYGETWHRGGMLESKQNVFDDFIAAGEYMISQNYTTRDRLSIRGGSNGGLLTAACLTQRPDLFGAVIIQVPVLDMLRYHLFTAGRYWTGEYGSAENAHEFPFLYKYSPLHNVKMNTVYPPTLIMTADTDDRVVPGQARKFAASLLAADAGDNPIFIRIEKSAGHGGGKPVGKIIEGQADLYTFLLATTAAHI